MICASNNEIIIIGLTNDSTTGSGCHSNVLFTVYVNFVYAMSLSLRTNVILNPFGWYHLMHSHY